MKLAKYFLVFALVLGMNSGLPLSASETQINVTITSYYRPTDAANGFFYPEVYFSLPFATSEVQYSLNPAQVTSLVSRINQIYAQALAATPAPGDPEYAWIFNIKNSPISDPMSGQLDIVSNILNEAQYNDPLFITHQDGIGYTVGSSPGYGSGDTSYTLFNTALSEFASNENNLTYAVANRGISSIASPKVTMDFVFACPTPAGQRIENLQLSPEGGGSIPVRLVRGPDPTGTAGQCKFLAEIASFSVTGDLKFYLVDNFLNRIFYSSRFSLGVIVGNTVGTVIGNTASTTKASAGADGGSKCGGTIEGRSSNSIAVWFVSLLALLAVFGFRRNQWSLSAQVAKSASKRQ